MKYQLIAAGPLKESYINTLETEIMESMSGLGLDKDEYLEVLKAEQKGQINWDGIPVMVWFGGNNTPDSQELNLLDDFLKNNAPVFPVVETLSSYPQLVPSQLHRINGQEWDSARLAADVLRAFQLSRSQRQAFVSYRRSETRNVAVQLFSELSLRGYQAFLDTASVESGVDFQEALWGRMVDVDLLIFLDSPDALSSQWVHQELNRAQALGLGILQLIWPDHDRTLGTEFCDFIQLETSAFSNGQADLDDRLTDETVKEILSAAERSRIRSLGSRRRRVVADFVDQVKRVHLDAEVHPIDKIEVYRDSQLVGSVIPFVGLPNAQAIQRHEEQLAEQDLPNIRIVYDGLGMNPDWDEHLTWLNAKKLSPITIQIELVDDWLEKL